MVDGINGRAWSLSGTKTGTTVPEPEADDYKRPDYLQGDTKSKTLKGMREQNDLFNRTLKDDDINQGRMLKDTKDLAQRA